MPPTDELISNAYTKTVDKSDLWRNLFENPTTVQFDHRVLVSSSMRLSFWSHSMTLLPSGNDDIRRNRSSLRCNTNLGTKSRASTPYSTLSTDNFRCCKCPASAWHLHSPILGSRSFGCDTPSGKRCPTIGSLGSRDELEATISRCQDGSYDVCQSKNCSEPCNPCTTLICRILASSVHSIPTPPSAASLIAKDEMNCLSRGLAGYS